MSGQEIDWLLKEKYHGEKTPAFYNDCKRLAKGEPLAYLIGWVPFLNCKIYLDHKPLIPRPETEYWTKEAITAIKHKFSTTLDNSPASPKILDLCAGSGCIGVAVAKAIPEARVDFVEIDAKLIPTIKKNLETNRIEDKRTKIIHSNLFSNITESYDFILSNPPYLAAYSTRVQDSVTKYEPYVALFAGTDGLDVIRDIIAASPFHLSSGGELWLEHDPEQTDVINKLARENNFFVSTHQDQYKVERYSTLVLK